MASQNEDDQNGVPATTLRFASRDHEDAVLRFLYDPAVPFTNNIAEHAVRMAKLRIKISGCFRTFDGARNFVILRGAADTARKQGWNVIDAFKTPSAMLTVKLRVA